MTGAGHVGPDDAEGVAFTHLDRPLFDGSGVTKGDLVTYLDAVSGPLVGVLSGRALSVVRVREGQPPFMQKKLPGHAPDWVAGVTLQTQDGREVRYPVCGDRRTLLWFGNQRAVEYHPQLFAGAGWDAPTHLVLDVDPPEGGGAFALAAAAARLVREVLAAAGTACAVKSSGAKGVHVVVPLAAGTRAEDVAPATRAVAARAERVDPALATTAFIREDRGGKVFLDATRSGGATVVAAYSPRVRPGVPVSFPLAWEDLDGFGPADATVRTVPALLAGGDRWADLMPPPQALDPGLVDEGRTIPVARVAAMHEGKRRARARRETGADPG